ncbi:condensation protein, partial [Streptomyces scabiei]|nr:condensation protein [Streptomyces scabiei]
MTTLDHPARDDAAPGPVRIPFPVVDEVSRHCAQEQEPETVHIEVHLPGRLDPGRLRTAFVTALRAHPRILMREAPGRWWSRRYEWELTEGPEVEVVAFPPAGPHALRDARTRSLVEAPPLTLSPPIRLEVVRGAGPAVGSEATDAVGLAAGRPAAGAAEDAPAGPDRTAAPGEPKGTVLFLTVNHTALDGPACLRILATAAQLYGGEDPQTGRAVERGVVDGEEE